MFKVIKYLIIFVILSIIGYIALELYFSAEEQEQNDITLKEQYSKDDVVSATNVLVKPTIISEDDLGRMFKFTAESVEQLDEVEVPVELIKGFIELKKDTKLNFEANKALYNSERNSLSMEGKVEVSYGGMQISGEDFYLDIEDKTLRSDNPVKGESSEFGKFSADNLRIENEGAKIKATHVNLTYESPL